MDAITATSSATGTSGLVGFVRIGRDGPVVQVHRQEDVVRDGVAQLLRELPDEARGAGEQREAAQQLQRQALHGQVRDQTAGRKQAMAAGRT